MPDLTPNSTEQVIAACGTNVDEAAGALSRALDGNLSLSVGEAGTFNATELPDGLDDGPGLVLVMSFGEVGMVALLPESTGFVPDWCATPDPTGESKLSTLAQELSMLLVPDDLMADEYAAARVENMQEALARGGITDTMPHVPLTLSGDDGSGILHLLWPLSTPGLVLSGPESSDQEGPNSELSGSTGDNSPAAVPPVDSSGPPQPPAPFRALSDRDFRRLPAYTRSLFKVQVPVRVCLASKKQSIHEIIELGPGSIVQFEKSYDEMLEMCIGERQIAEGEVVKVGDSYGLRITSIMMPEERFKKVCRPT